MTPKWIKDFQNYVDTATTNLENIPRTNLVGNAALDVAQFGMPIVQAVAHPVQTTKAVGKAVTNLPETAKTIIKEQNDFYDGKNKLQNLYEHPLKPATDVLDALMAVELGKGAYNLAKPAIKTPITNLNKRVTANIGKGNIDKVGSPITTQPPKPNIPSIEPKLEPQPKYFSESPMWINDTTFNPNYEKGTIYTHGSPNVIDEGSHIWAQSLKGKPRITDEGMWGNAAYMAPMSTEKNALISNSYARGNGGNYLVDSVNTDYLLKADVPITNNPNNIKAAYKNFYKNLGYNDRDIETMMLTDTGQDFYDRVAKYATDNNLDTNLLLNANGVAGVLGKYFTGGQQAAIFNELNNSIIGNKLSESAYWNLIDKLGY